MVSWTSLLHLACFREPVLQFPVEPALGIFSCCADRDPPAGETHGEDATDKEIRVSRDELVVVIEPWSVQYEGTCSHYNIC